MQPKITVITAAHNDLKNVKNLFESFDTQSYRNFEILIVDDGSTDNTTAWIETNYPETKIIRGDGNLWWTGALYEAISCVLEYKKSPDFILTINIDCTFDADYLENIVKNATKNPKTIVGSLILDKDNPNRIWDGGVKINWPKGKFIQCGPENTEQLIGNFNADIDTITTKGTLYPFQLFKDIGNLDKKNLPHYLSDYEFGCRAKKNGYNLMIHYDCLIYNNTTNTGIGENLASSLNGTEIINFLFGKKSKINIIDHYQFIRLCCPAIYKPLNYFYLILKTFFIISHFKPFYFIHPILKKLRT